MAKKPTPPKTTKKKPSKLKLVKTKVKKSNVGDISKIPTPPSPIVINTPGEMSIVAPKAQEIKPWVPQPDYSNKPYIQQTSENIAVKKTDQTKFLVKNANINFKLLVASMAAQTAAIAIASPWLLVAGFILTASAAGSIGYADYKINK